MIQLIHADERDPMKVEFGPLRALIDRTLDPEEGIRTHPHNEIEIVTIALAGERTHKDAREAINVIPAGSAHRMSAGTGVTHAEFNLGDEPARFLQVWIDPDVHGVPPAYEMRDLPAEGRMGRPQPIATGDDDLDGLMIYGDATIYLADLEAGDAVEWEAEAGRMAYLYVYEGTLLVHGHETITGDEVRIVDEPVIRLVPDRSARLVLVDLPALTHVLPHVKTLPKGHH